MSQDVFESLSSKACPCGSTEEFTTCCNPYIAGQQTAPTAEALMRSRYTAFTLGDLDYIEQTITEEASQSFNRVDMERSLPGTEWLGFEVRDTTGGQEGDAAGTVTFAFHYRNKKREFSQVEMASFRSVNGTWLYHDSEINPKSPPARVENIGRNEPCRCGSGKKYKKCCGAQA
ncbi:YchJ family protein [Rhizobium sp. PL01]|uniref:YchJ family protein n=1 Tax=Rhizobium sp. PL01 TaxID=3085631 RepID=UPI0029814B5D|nr:YchJ family protein [Rhizobium sp. PL01]MDW5317601.1 YchJ family protein [Rhizobium sp. PL01]